jgi:hypothetical protein
MQMQYKLYMPSYDEHSAMTENPTSIKKCVYDIMFTRALYNVVLSMNEGINIKESIYII